MSRYQKGKTNLDFTEARDSEWQWHQLGHMQVCTALQTDNHASTPPLFLQAGCPSCRPTNSVKALKGLLRNHAFEFHQTFYACWPGRDRGSDLWRRCNTTRRPTSGFVYDLRSSCSLTIRPSECDANGAYSD